MNSVEMEKKMGHPGQVSLKDEPPSSVFISWREKVFTPLVAMGLLGISGLAGWECHRLFDWGLFAAVLVAGTVNVIVSILAVRLLCAGGRFSPGKYDRHHHPWTLFAYNLYSFILSTHLYHFTRNPIFVPPTFQVLFLKFLGMRSEGFSMVAGQVTDPFSVTLESDVVVGGGALILGHYMTASQQLRLGAVLIKHGALIGVNAIVFPDCVIGENATVCPAAVVIPGTVIPDQEVWSGNPARKDERLSEMAMKSRSQKSQAGD